jgi:hypothetical protein
MTTSGADTRFAIVSLPRCGSTTLARLLNCHPGVECLIEPFHPSRYGGRFHEMAIGARSVRGVLDLIWARYAGIKHVWESDGWPFPAMPELNEEIVSASSRTIVLIRRNWLRRVVSNYLCRHTGVWIGTRSDFLRSLNGRRLRPLSPDGVITQIRQDKEAVSGCLTAVARAGAATMILDYEDVFDENKSDEQRFQFVNALLAFIDRPPVTHDVFMQVWRPYFEPVTFRWASPEVYRRIPGIADLEAAVGCDETGWLFR